MWASRLAVLDAEVDKICERMQARDLTHEGIIELTMQYLTVSIEAAWHRAWLEAHLPDDSTEPVMLTDADTVGPRLEVQA